MSQLGRSMHNLFLTNSNLFSFLAVRRWSSPKAQKL